MKFFLIALILIASYSFSYSKWEIRNQKNQIRSFIELDGKLYMGLVNGMCIYDFKSKKNNYTNSIYSDLQGNYINSILKLPNGNGLLISSSNGLSLINKNGEITSAAHICESYPDRDARYLYTDDDGNIWTYSADKVYKYDGNNWKIFDLKEYINFRYDIKKLFVNNNEVWVLFNDLDETSTTFYSTWVDDRIRLLVISGDKVVKTFLSKDDFPYRQGNVQLASDSKDIILKNFDSVYVYHDSVWTVTDKFDIKDMKPNWYYDFVNDKKGNLWYVVNNENNFYRPAKYNIQTGEVTMYLENEPEKNIGKISILNDGQIIFSSNDNFYFQKDTGWYRVPSKDYGIPAGTYFSNVLEINNEKFVKIYYTNDDIKAPNGTFVCLDNQNDNIYPIKSDFPYASITTVCVNKKGQGIYNGKYYNDNLLIQVDSGFVKPDLFSNTPAHIVGPDGNVYFTDLRKNNINLSSYIITWEGNDFIEKDMGFSDKSSPSIATIKANKQYIAALGSYYIGKDSLNSYLSIYNFNTQELETHDTYNSSMPDYYYERVGGIFMFGKDTIPTDLALLPDGAIWIITTKSIIDFDGTDWKLYENPDTSFSFSHIYYDNKANELLFTKGYNIQWDSSIYYLNLDSFQWDSIKITDTGIKGKPLSLKEQIDSRVYVADNEGYLYNYIGNGKFKIIDLKINGNKNLGIPINDFCITIDNSLYFGTDIGLVYNKDLLSDVKSNLVTTDNNVTLYPNPTNSNINLKFSSAISQTLSIKITNYAGKIIKVFNINSNSITNDNGSNVKINVHDLQSGFYFMEITSKSKLIVKKFLVIK